MREQKVGGYLIPLLEKGEQGGVDCVPGGFFVHRAVPRDSGSSVRQKISPRPSFSKRGNGFAM